MCFANKMIIFWVRAVPLSAPYQPWNYRGALNLLLTLLLLLLLPLSSPPCVSSAVLWMDWSIHFSPPLLFATLVAWPLKCSTQLGPLTSPGPPHPSSTNHHSQTPSSTSLTPPHPAALLGFLLICMRTSRASGIHWQPTNEPARRADMVSPPLHPSTPFTLDHSIPLILGLPLLLPLLLQLSSDLALQQTLSSLDPHLGPSDPQRANYPTVV
ncbi:unnamed protein product [Lota lota]